jgi:hypothetical protein
MIIFDIPFAPLRHGEWSVEISNDGHSEFKSRKDALRFAVSSAVHAQRQGDDTLITIQGGDGQWRMFDYRAKGVA